MKELVLKFEGTGSEHESCYGTFKKLVRNSEYSKSENFKKLTVLAKFLKIYLVSLRLSKSYCYYNLQKPATLVEIRVIFLWRMQGFLQSCLNVSMHRLA